MNPTIFHSEQSKPDISVVIPIYNMEKYLHECMDSILAQTLTNIEIICVNDGSTDSSAQILNEYAAKDSRMTVLSIENSSAGAARNVGIDVARGEYITFLDADDIFEPELLQRQYEQITKEQADICICRALQFGATTPKTIDFSINTSLLPPQHTFLTTCIKDNLFQFCIGWPWDKLFKKSLIDKYQLRFQSLHHQNDVYFVFMYMALCEKITYIDDVLIKYRIRNDSISHCKDDYPDCYALALKHLYDELRSHHLYKTYKHSFFKFAMSLYIWSYEDMQNEQSKRCVQKSFNDLQKYTHWRRYELFSILFSFQKTNKHCVLTIFGIKIKFRHK